MASGEKMAGDLVPFIDIIRVVKEHRPAGGGFIGGVGSVAAIVHRKFLEVGQDAQRQVGIPGVAPQLVGGVNVVCDIHFGLFGFYKEFALPADLEGVIGGFGCAFDIDRILDAPPRGIRESNLYRCTCPSPAL